MNFPNKSISGVVSSKKGKTILMKSKNKNVNVIVAFKQYTFKYSLTGHLHSV